MSNCVCSGKDSANRTEYETKMDFFVSIPEVPPIFAAQRQSSARRVKSKTNNNIFVSEQQKAILAKIYHRSKAFSESQARKSVRCLLTCG